MNLAKLQVLLSLRKAVFLSTENKQSKMKINIIVFQYFQIFRIYRNSNKSYKRFVCCKQQSTDEKINGEKD